MPVMSATPFPRVSLVREERGADVARAVLQNCTVLRVATVVDNHDGGGVFHRPLDHRGDDLARVVGWHHDMNA